MGHSVYVLTATLEKRLCKLRNVEALRCVICHDRIKVGQKVDYSNSESHMYRHHACIEKSRY